MCVSLAVYSTKSSTFAYNCLSYIFMLISLCRVKNNIKNITNKIKLTDLPLPYNLQLSRSRYTQLFFNFSTFIIIIQTARSVNGRIEQLLFDGLRCGLTNDRIYKKTKTSDEEQHSNLFIKDFH